MCKLQNIHINSNGELNTDCRGKLASLSDLENAICEGHKEITGLLQLADGQYKWQSAEMQRKILELDEDITEEELEELDEITGEYLLINKSVPSLYTEFTNYLDLGLEEIISCNFDAEEPLILVGITHMYNSMFTHVLNFWKDFETKEIKTSDVIIPSFMLKQV